MKNNKEYVKSQTFNEDNKEYVKSQTFDENNKEQKFSELKNLSEFAKTDFIPTFEHKISSKKNTVYCVTFLYAWDEIRKIINQPLIILSNYSDLLLLNNSKSFINVLKSSEYSTSVTVNGDSIIAKAEFSKSLPFEIELNSYDNLLTFKGEKVIAFGIGDNNYREQLSMVKIVYYENDNNFIIKLLPKDENHEIILFKTDKVFQSMAEMNEEIAKLSEIGKEEQKNGEQKWKYDFTGSDKLAIPKFNFNIKTNYATLEEKHFKTIERDYRIVKAWQRTAFLLGESGAEIESKSEVIVTKSKIAPKKMFFDKDFLILLKRIDAENPYFGLWVTNTELMIKEE